MAQNMMEWATCEDGSFLFQNFLDDVHFGMPWLGSVKVPTIAPLFLFSTEAVQWRKIDSPIEVL